MDTAELCTSHLVSANAILVAVSVDQTTAPLADYLANIDSALGSIHRSITDLEEVRNESDPDLAIVDFALRTLRDIESILSVIRANADGTKSTSSSDLMDMATAAQDRVARYAADYLDTPDPPDDIKA
jgi:hypothetical protein